jgi:hypothetical protein
MAIFPHLILEETIQVNDKTRIDATKSFISKTEAAVTLVEIEPESGSGFVTVGGPGVNKDWYLDWQYSGATRTVTVSCRITTNAAPVTVTKTIAVKTAADDKLLSNDDALVTYEHDVMRFVKDGRSSFLNFHRKARDLMVRWINDAGYRDDDGQPITVDALLVDVSEVKEWASCQALALIYYSISNTIGDVFDAKSGHYMSKVGELRNKAMMRLDLDGNTEIDDGEFVRMKSVPIYRR